jgi:HK97 family phage major capsid protein
MNIKLLKAFQFGADLHSEGDVVDVDDILGKQLIDGGVAEAHNIVEVGLKAAAAAEAAAKAEAEMTERITKAVSDKITEKVNITVGRDNSESDPACGYLGEHNKSLKDITDRELSKIMGNFAQDVAKAHGAAQLPPRLKKRLEMHQRDIQAKVKSGVYSPNAEIVKAAGDGYEVSSDEFGGFTVPTAVSYSMMQGILEASIVRPRATVLTTDTQMLELPYCRDEDHSSGTVYEGIQIYFDDELGQLTASRAKLGQLGFKMKKMTALWHASEEIIRWGAVAMGSFMNQKYPEALAWKEDLSFINGPGGAQPLGILNSTAAISITKETGQVADTYVLENSTKQVARMKSMRRAGWLMNRNVFPQLPQFNVTAGTGGTAVFVNDASSATPQSLWGYPIIFTEKVPTLGDAGDVTLTDFADYVIVDDANGVDMQSSIHLKFDYAQRTFRILKWVDGQNATPTALTPANGDSLSTVVKVAARA